MISFTAQLEDNIVTVNRVYATQVTQIHTVLKCTPNLFFIANHN